MRVREWILGGATRDLIQCSGLSTRTLHRRMPGPGLQSAALAPSGA
ncbi:hypothetical protein CYD53_12039 [Bosea psychrotolerans]|uniref:Uncharacterized protein n=1 Tax=Bosea psychrotolerans TaxID=1871628 RepID=A0A2S4LXQ3_9HYPH|nr:hypothetical protein CYD53_12039 [Bosea psychrotolerans]